MSHMTSLVASSKLLVYYIAAVNSFGLYVLAYKEYSEQILALCE